MDPFEQCAVRRFRRGGFASDNDEVIREARVELVVNDGDLSMAMLCLPRELRELAAGFLRGEGALRSRDDIESIRVDEQGRTVRVSGRFAPKVLENITSRWTWGTGCGGGGTAATLSGEIFRQVGQGAVVGAESLLELTRQFAEGMDLWKRTGGVHACALADAERVMILSEDVGRHNAMDKVLGRALLEDVDTSDKLILTTGRVSTEMVSKAVACGVALVAGRGAATTLSLELARRFGVTLVGFARTGRFNVYTGFQRVTDSPKSG